MPNHSKSTAAQRAEVERLAAEGVPFRRIAAEVFGDARYKGRVERILRSQAAAIPRSPDGMFPALDPGELSRLSARERLQLLFERRLAWLAQQEGTVSMNELYRLVQVERQLEAMAELERLRDRQRQRHAEQLASLGDQVEPVGPRG